MYSKYRYVKPSEIRFTQQSIPNNSGGQIKTSCNQVIDEIIGGRLSPSTIPPIRVIEWDNKFYTEDNRKLYILRTAEYSGAVKEIKVLDGGISNVQWLDEFTTENDGKEICLRGDVTKEHYKPNWLQDNRNGKISPEEDGPGDNPSYVVIETDGQDEHVHSGSSLCLFSKKGACSGWSIPMDPRHWGHGHSHRQPWQVKTKENARYRSAGCCTFCECGDCCICNSMVLCLMNLVMLIMGILGFIYIMTR